VSGPRDYLRLVFIAGLVAMATVCGTSEAEAHTLDELDAWSQAWATKADVGLSSGATAELRAMARRHPWYFTPQGSTTPSFGTAEAPRAVEGWRSLVAGYFKAQDVDLALAIIHCESRGDPGAVNPRTGASGLFQQMPHLWPSRSSAAGFAGASILNPQANIAASAWLVYSGGGWRHWTDFCECCARAAGL
jgi:soluble lytic murein transglycosylase-like protein